MTDEKQEWLQDFLQLCNASKTTGFDLVGVCETFVPKRIKAGGQCMPDSHCPTKTLSVHGDIWPDQPDVPATVCMERRQVRFCKSNYLRRCNENCVLGRCPPHLSELRSVEP